MKNKIKYIITNMTFLAFIFLFTISIPTANAAPVTIDCSVGTPRNIAQITDFASGDDLTLSGVGTCVLTNAATLASLTIGNGSTATVLKHTNNTTAQTYSLDITTTGNINVTTGASIDVDGLGYSGGGNGANGAGSATGKGIYSNDAGGGGSHGGNGGIGSPIFGGDAAGGTADCAISNPNTIGSGGGGGNAGTGGAGGGLIKLTATGTITVDGTITADGTNAVANGGGGGGGGVKLVADIIAGSPDGFTATGGDHGDNAWDDGGGGGGGCVYIEYTTSNNIAGTSISMNGGVAVAAENGGAGQVLIKDSDSGDGDLYVINGGTLGANTPLLSTPLTVDTITVNDDAIYNIAVSDVLNIEDGNSVLSSNNDGIINIYGTLNASTGTIDIFDNVTFNLYSSGTIENGTALSITADAALYIYSGATIENSTLTSLTTSGTALLIPSGMFTSLGTFTINAGTVTMDNYSTSTAQTVTNLVVNGGTLTHSDNSSAQTHILNIDASGDITIGASGTISADNLGYDGGGNTTNGAGSATGKGIYGGNFGGGGGHGGNGGRGAHVDGTGGTADCTSGNPATIGSGGAGGNGGTGGSGGGLIILTATSGTVTVSGTITTDGANYAANHGGGGAGGGVKLVADTIAGTPSSFTATGGSGDYGGGGGGGCVYVGYSTSISTSIDEIGDITLTGGTSSNAVAGSIGVFLAEQLNTAPTASAITPSQTAVGTVTLTSTVADVDSNVTSLTVEYSTDNASWSNATIATATQAGSEGDGITIAGAGSLTDLDTDNDGSVDVTIGWNVGTDLTNTIDSTVYFRITPNDGTVDGSTATSAAFAINTNLPPTASAITPSQSAASTVTITSTVADTESNVTSLTVEYSTDNASWSNATIATATQAGGEGDGITIAGAGSLTDLDTDNDGSVDVTIGWNVGTDLADTDDSTVYFRITPIDGTASSNGTTATSAAFAVDTLAPTTPSTPTSSTLATTSFTLIYPSAVTETNFTEYKVFYSTSSPVSESDTAITQAENSDFASRTFSSNPSFSVTSLTQNTTYYFKLYAYDGFGHSSSSGELTVDTLAVPTASAISPTQTASSNNVTFTTTVADADSDVTSLTVEYSTDNAAWNNATITTATQAGGEGDGVTIAGAGSLTDIDTDNDGSVDLTITWDAGTDLADTDDTTVYFRVRPNDGTVNGSYATSSAFALDTLAPTTPSALTTTGITSSSITLVYPSAVTETNFTEYKVFYSTTASVTESDTAITQSANTDFASRTFSSDTSYALPSTLSSNTTYYFKLYAYDDFGHSSSSSEISARTNSGSGGGSSGSGNINSGITIVTPDTPTTTTATDTTTPDTTTTPPVTDPPEEAQTPEEITPPETPGEDIPKEETLLETYTKIIPKIITKAETTLEEKFVNYYYIHYQFKCLSSFANPESAMCLNAKIDLIYAQTLTGKTKVNISLSTEDLYIINLRFKWPEKRYQNYCVNAKTPALYCSSLQESLKKIYYFIEEK